MEDRVPESSLCSMDAQHEILEMWRTGERVQEKLVFEGLLSTFEGSIQSPQATA
jgi:hypothetical protein